MRATAVGTEIRGPIHCRGSRQADGWVALGRAADDTCRRASPRTTHHAPADPAAPRCRAAHPQGTAGSSVSPTGVRRRGWRFGGRCRNAIPGDAPHEKDRPRDSAHEND